MKGHLHPLLAAADTLITLLIFAALAVLSSWLKKRQRGDESQQPWTKDESGAPPPVPRSPAQRRPGPGRSWEEELRRLLEGEEARPAPPVIRAPPPPPPAPVTKPRPLVRTPVPSVEESEMDKGLTVELPTLAESAQSYERASQLDQTVGDHMRQRAGLATAASAYLHASQLERKVAEHMRRATEETRKLPVPRRAGAVSNEATQVRSLLQDRRSIRSAVLASVILGSPRGLET
jgi:hypothetical protein